MQGGRMERNMKKEGDGENTYLQAIHLALVLCRHGVSLMYWNQFATLLIRGGSLPSRRVLCDVPGSDEC